MDELTPLLRQAQSGDQKVRGELLQAFRPFVLRVASACCGRTLQWDHDDELSIAFMALDEAITSFHEGAGRKFPSHARQVIVHRLIDFFRKQRRNMHLSLDAMMQAAGEEVSASLEADTAWERFRAQEEENQRRTEILEYNRILKEYGLSLVALKEHCPKHKDTRHQMLQIARKFADNAPLVQHLRRTKQLPLKEVALITGASRKVLETHRRYLVALVLILMHGELAMLRTFAGLDSKGGGD